MVIELILFFIIGTVLGSFYNVVGYRLPKEESVLNPKHSYCTHCNKRLKWCELIPVLSYFIQGGKCRYCKNKISFFYPVIEILTGLLFAVSFYSFGYSYELIISLTLSSLFCIVIVSDINYLIIPDEVTLISVIIITVVQFLIGGLKGGLEAIGSGILLFIIMYLIMLLGNFMFKKESLGGADIKLMFVAGVLLGPLIGLLVIFLSSVIALPVSLIIYLVDRDNVIPFGPFIVAAMLILFLLKIDLNMFLSLFS